MFLIKIVLKSILFYVLTVGVLTLRSLSTSVHAEIERRMWTLDKPEGRDAS